MPSDDPLDYVRLMQHALRGVVRDALGLAAEEGLPGGHHFYVTFDTGHPGVDMPDWLAEQHPEELTIVLQHEFWDLAVTGDRFSVGLSFSGRPVVLTVPFDAVLTFVDPHAEFGLKFDPQEAEEPTEEEGEAALTQAAREAEDAGEEDEPSGAPEGGGEVVSLDRFRKS
ncbi:MAG: SspB family protein [Pseudomonadota bacterium]